MLSIKGLTGNPAITRILSRCLILCAHVYILPFLTLRPAAAVCPFHFRFTIVSVASRLLLLTFNFEHHELGPSDAVRDASGDDTVLACGVELGVERR